MPVSFLWLLLLPQVKCEYTRPSHKGALYTPYSLVHCVGSKSPICYCLTATVTIISNKVFCSNRLSTSIPQHFPYLLLLLEEKTETFRGWTHPYLVLVTQLLGTLQCLSVGESYQPRVQDRRLILPLCLARTGLLTLIHCNMPISCMSRTKSGWVKNLQTVTINVSIHGYEAEIVKMVTQ